jgi:hypothetical protein
MSKLPVFLIVMSAVLAGCSEPEAEPEPLTPARTLDAVARVGCELPFDCCTEGELHEHFAGWSPQPTTVEGCAAVLRASLETSVGARLTGSIEAGRVVFDAEQAANCVRTLEAITCEAYGASQSVLQIEGLGCDDFLIGQVADGGACALDSDCAQEDRYCAGLASNPMGVCTAFPALGADCDLVCGADAYCSVTTEVCTAKVADGGDCTYGSQCESGLCQDGTTCGTPAPLCDGPV